MRARVPKALGSRTAVKAPYEHCVVDAWSGWRVLPVFTVFLVLWPYCSGKEGPGRACDNWCCSWQSSAAEWTPFQGRLRCVEACR